MRLVSGRGCLGYACRLTRWRSSSDDAVCLRAWAFRLRLPFYQLDVQMRRCGLSEGVAASATLAALPLGGLAIASAAVALGDSAAASAAGVQEGALGDTAVASAAGVQDEVAAA